MLFMEQALHYFAFSWAVVGIADSNACRALQARQEPIERTVERYVEGYLNFWHIVFIDKERIKRVDNKETIEQGRAKLKAYIATHPPVVTLPRFYIVFLNQPQIGCDAYGLSDVFCV